MKKKHRKAKATSKRKRTKARKRKKTTHVVHARRRTATAPLVAYKPKRRKSMKRRSKAVARLKGGGRSVARKMKGILPKGKDLIMHPVKKLAQGGEGVAMAKGTSFLLSKLPITNPRMKAGIQAALGLGISIFTDRHEWLRGVGDGPYYAGIFGLSRSFGHEVMAGEEDYHLAINGDGELVELTGDELAQLQGNLNGENFNGDDSGFRMASDLNGEDSPAFSMR